MTEFLVKKFVKDYENTNNSKVRSSYGMLSGFIGVICNILLFAVKFIGGFLINSISVTADAFNNLSDAASSIVTLVGTKISQKPADKEHPFGHGRSEYIAAFIVAFLVLQVGFTCFKNSFGKILKPEAVVFNSGILVLLILSVLVKLWLALFNRGLGKKINSGVLKATGTDAFGDVLITSVTILSIVIGKATGLKIDGWMGALVSAVVIIAGFNIAKETLEPLLGEAIDKETYENITKRVEGYKGILGCHDLIVHNYGPSHIMATIHVEVQAKENLEGVHEIIDRIERDILREMGIFLVIHVDPVNLEDEESLSRKKEIIDIIKKIEPEASVHDFRIIEEDDKVKLIFDMLIPYSYGEKQRKQLLSDMDKELKKLNERYEPVVTLDNSFIGE
ncbi:cation diffusion facilitator family transporter [Anaerocolumna xylanovorans]|uniref:Cation diffusion facilitator family transporter n=1 Tax=Anaerocolumna xylanovorans DSM 12503 TaxID=1121345 RepID=A0A1M7YN50_9FIRM|nr:cation diffusion facilitator family transporter [Anaerocolumna xylanovorans]SHO54044.1 cation diffusion facilitator family transporter [Anaerocolumna xylanovorans DSM 12503]